MAHKTVVVSVDVTTYQSSLTTNEHGLVNIYIDTTNFTSSLFTVMVSEKTLLRPQNLNISRKRINSREERNGNKE